MCSICGEIVLGDRSWHNRAGVEHVLGFCTPAELVSISHAEQERGPDGAGGIAGAGDIG